MKTILFYGFLAGLPCACAAGEESKPTPSQPGEDASRTIRGAKAFIIGKAYEEGRITEPEIELRALLKQEDASAKLQVLLKEASLPGQLYALLGLRLLGDGGFDAAYERFKDSKSPVDRISGCIKSTTTAEDIAAKIKDGTIQ